jgi:4-hydroxy-2-oxoheptanedioate aldolase
MNANPILARNRAGLRARVFNLVPAAPELIEIAAIAGFDAVQLDGEHGATTLAEVDVACRVAAALGLAVIARVPSIAPNVLTAWLDRGVQCVIAPHVENAQEAARFVSACLYPPAGTRSWGLARATRYGERESLVARHGSIAAFGAFANANMLLFAQIESSEGHRNAAEILAVPGLAGVVGGPWDLAGSLGVPGEPEHPEVARFEAELRRRARAAGRTHLFDLIVRTGTVELMLGEGRRFAAAAAESRIGEDAG